MTTPLLPQASPARAHLDALTSLRFVAAFAVLVLHYRDLLGPMPDWLMRGIVGGQYGVTLFFILSGFILTYRYQEWFAQGVSAPRFWRFQRYRLARVYPVYLLGLLLDTPWHLIERVQVGQLAASGHTYWASWLLNLIGLQAWVPGVPFAMFWNTPAWSVSAEFFFYATFPFVCAWLAARWRTRASLATLFAAVVLGGAVLYAGVIYLINYVWPASGETQYLVLVYNPLLRFSEFVAGCIAGQFFLKQGASSWRLAAGTAGARRWRDGVLVLSTFAVAVRVWSPDYTGPSQWLWLLDVSVKYAIFILPFTAIILAVASGPTCLSWLLEQRWMVALGEASYALYIVHWSVTTFLRMGYLGNMGNLGHVDTRVVHIAFLVSTVGASLLVYHVVEVPWRKRLRGQPGQSD